MIIEYKIDILAALKQKGYSSTKLRNEKLLSESSMQKLRNKKPVGLEIIAKICTLLECQPGDVLELKEENEDKSEE